MTSELPLPEEPSDPAPTSESPAPGNHTPDDHRSGESARPTDPGSSEGSGEAGRTGTPKRGCAMALALVVLVLLGVTAVPVALLLG